LHHNTRDENKKVQMRGGKGIAKKKKKLGFSAKQTRLVGQRAVVGGKTG